MNIEAITTELFKLLSLEKQSSYTSDIEERNKHKIKYSIYNEYYFAANRDNSFSYVFGLKDKVLKTALEHEEKYKELYEKFKTEKNPEEKKKLVGLINEIVYKIEAYNEVYNLFNRNLKLDNKDSIDFSNKVINLLNRRNHEKVDKRVINEKIYSMLEERRVRLTSKTDESILRELCELESIEERMASTDVSIPEYTVNIKEYVRSLKDTIEAINEYYFLDYKKSKHYVYNNEYNADENKVIFDKRHIMYLNKYYTLISSLFKNDFYIIDVDGVKVSTDDLVNYLSIYNIDDNYDIFKVKYKNKKIGNEEINRVDYDKSLSFINKCIDTLVNDCYKTNVKEVTVAQKGTNIVELKKQRDLKLTEIYSIVNKKDSYAKK